MFVKVYGFLSFFHFFSPYWGGVYSSCQFRVLFFSLVLSSNLTDDLRY